MWARVIILTFKEEPLKFRLEWKSLPVTNTLAYYLIGRITTVKSCLTQAPSASMYGKNYKRVTLIVYYCNNTVWPVL